MPRRPVGDTDIGLKILRDVPVDAIDAIDIVAIHGLGAHPDDTWFNDPKSGEDTLPVNWLEDEKMLPAVAPQARIMRYGYKSAWFGRDAMEQNTSDLARRLLLALNSERKALLDARDDEARYPGIHKSATGYIFLGTPFRGTGVLNPMEMLAAAQKEYRDDGVRVDVLNIFIPGNAYLQRLVTKFTTMWNQADKAQIACFYETMPSNIGGLVGNDLNIKMIVDKSSGCLDSGDSIQSFPLARNHYQMNKFGNSSEEDFRILKDEIEEMIGKAQEIMLSRSQNHDKHKVNFSLRGVPAINHYVPRTILTQKLENLMLKNPTPNRRNVVVFHGLGGIGKTQLAVEFARQQKENFSAVFWLNGSSEMKLKESFIDMFRRLPENELSKAGRELVKESKIDNGEAIKECNEWLSQSSNKRWLLIFDNADRDFRDKKDSHAYDPKSYFPDADHGSILVTTRLAYLARLGTGIKVDTVTTKQAQEILEACAEREIEEVELILRLLDGLPLALSQAGAFMRERNITAAEYKEKYNQTWQRLIKSQDNFQSEEYGDRGILTTWTMSYNQVESQSKEAASLLKLWSFLDNADIWFDMFNLAMIAVGVSFPPWVSKIGEDKLDFDDAVALLSRYSLASVKEGTNGYIVHSVPHRWCSGLVDAEEHLSLTTIAAAIVAINVPEWTETESYEKWNRIVPHGISLCKWIVEDQTQNNPEICTVAARMDILNTLGELLLEEDDTIAAKMFLYALQAYENADDDLQLDISRAARGLSLIYRRQHRWKEAENFLQRALVATENKWGRDSSLTLLLMLNLGALYTDMEEYRKAEEYLERALAGCEKMIKEGKTSIDMEEVERHLKNLETESDIPLPSVLLTLGILYRKTKRNKLSESALKRALREMESMNEQGYPSSIPDLRQLGVLYQEFGKYKEAADVFKQVLIGNETKFGKTHFKTIDTVMKLAEVYGQMYKWTESQKLRDRAMTGFRTLLGDKGMDTNFKCLTAMWACGLFHCKTGELEKGKYWIMRSRAGFQQVAPDDTRSQVSIECESPEHGIIGLNLNGQLILIVGENETGDPDLDREMGDQFNALAGI